MTPFGLMILIQPAILCLGIASAMLSAGVMAIGTRRIDNRHVRRLLPVLTGSLFFTFFAIYTTVHFAMPPLTIETISGL